MTLLLLSHIAQYALWFIAGAMAGAGLTWWIVTKVDA
jgi:hypothetical protein